MIPTPVFRRTLEHFLAPVRDFLDDERVQEIMINGPDEIFVERDGRIEPTGARFADEEALHAAVVNIAQLAGRFVRAEEPRFDARLPDGHRVHVVMPPVSRCGISVTIRKHTTSTLTLEDLVRMGSLSVEARDFLADAMGRGDNLIVSGGTGTGKTTMLNALSALIPAAERVVTIEDSAELQIQGDHVVSLETRAADRKGRGAVAIRDLIHSALRMRPDRIIVGECRGAEALDLLQAMNTGHGGSMSTLHANSPEGAMERLETLALFAGEEIPLKFVRAQVAAAIRVVVQLQRLGGRRTVQSVALCHGLGDGGGYSLERRFEWSLEEEALVPVAAPPA